LVEVILIRHAQASFGAADYDVLSELGHEQAHALGRALKRQGVAPGAVFIGAQRRHRETFEGLAEGLGLEPAPVTVHEGLNEYDFKALLDARFAGVARPEGTDSDRRTHFRVLRDTVLEWQRDGIADPPERWAEFTARVRDARDAMIGHGAARVLAVSSGGAIAQMVADTLQTPPAQMIGMQLQMKNCAVTRLIAGRNALYLHGFNETPHIDADTAPRLLTYS
jgi:broad specificity phosphatase PhoE